MKKHLSGIIWMLTGLLVALPVHGGLMEYVNRPEPVFSWELRGEEVQPLGTLYDLYLVSQVWQDIQWEHQLQVYVPKQVDYQKTMLLLITGGKASKSDMTFGFMLAKLMGLPCAALYHIPNQPLFDGKTEDELIAHTLVQFIETGDESWPLLFPMAKSAVKAMDALQAFAQETLESPIDRFIVTGGSKRGWTSWLTGAVDDRVQAIIPIVIDVLNIPEQLPHQLEVWGEYSDEIADYTRRGLQQQIKSGRGKEVFRMIDPYTYRDRLTMPKLLLIGTNDRYWTLDALNIYWDELQGPKYVLYVQNSGHGLEGERARAVSSLTGFSRFIASGQTLPRLSWQHTVEDGRPQITIQAEPAPKSAQLWTASSPTRDFREAEWHAAPVAGDHGDFTGEVAAPEEGFVALFGEVQYEIDGYPCYFSTQVAIYSADSGRVKQ